jgi:hypothetical protein
MYSSRKRKACIFIPLGLASLCLLAVVVSALSNMGLPGHSGDVERLNNAEKARLAEVLHLQTALGDAVWPGWSQASIPLMVYNEKYAFLVGYPDPPAGWFKVPRMEARGGPWERVSGDLFGGQPYYRTPITDPTKTPEGFTVLVGNRWVATFQTREYSEIAFYRGLRSELPGIIAKVVPMRLAWKFLMGKADSYIATLEHESFHAYEGMLAPDSLAAAERIAQVEESYPFDAVQSAWIREMDVLLQAAQAKDRSSQRALVQDFLRLRDARRADLTAEQIELEQRREWEEGLAKYAELELSSRASNQRDYTPDGSILQDRDFDSYRAQGKLREGQLQEAKRTQGRSGDTWFYYSGNAIAVVLDALYPDWKAQALPGGRYLEDVLREAAR